MGKVNIINYLTLLEGHYPFFYGARAALGLKTSLHFSKYVDHVQDNVV